MSETDARAETRPSPSGGSRRRFLAALGGGLAAVAIAGPTRAQLAHLVGARLSDAGYGPLGPPDELGVRLPEGFTARLVGRSDDFVGRTRFRWHGAPDGGACFPASPNGRAADGHIYVSNSELPDGEGGVSAVTFDATGGIVGVRTILAGTSMNCSGGATPWGTWLSCEENGPAGHVWECDPLGGPARELPAMGSFNHEAAAVDPVSRQVFLTEDRPDGRLYRFGPERWTDLSAGRLEAASVERVGGVDVVSWVRTDWAAPDRSASTSPFRGGEGAVIVGRSLFFTTKGDRRVWELDLNSNRLTVFHDCIARPDTSLTHVDNLTVHPATGQLFVAEDGGDMELCMLVRAPAGPVITPVVRFEGHEGSEVAGPAFSPDGRFLYVSSQRGTDGAGMTIQVAGPFGPWIESITAPATTGRPARRVGNRHTPGG